MCGICGELRFDATSSDLAVIERMSETLARCGPDRAGTYAAGPVAFGHRRLAIIDLSASADQPMVDAELRLALVFNGTIYNYRELRTELISMGHTFASEGDSEVILKAYAAWGEQCVHASTPCSPLPSGTCAMCETGVAPACFWRAFIRIVSGLERVAPSMLLTGFGFMRPRSMHGGRSVRPRPRSRREPAPDSATPRGHDVEKDASRPRRRLSSFCPSL